MSLTMGRHWRMHCMHLYLRNSDKGFKRINPHVTIKRSIRRATTHKKVFIDHPWLNNTRQRQILLPWFYFTDLESTQSDRQTAGLHIFCVCQQTHTSAWSRGNHQSCLVFHHSHISLGRYQSIKDGRMDGAVEDHSLATMSFWIARRRGGGWLNDG